MRITKEKAAENRLALVQAAARLFRERGIDGVGVAEISKAAGLTHGALYAHFPTKEALAAEALAYGIGRGNAFMKTLGENGNPGLGDYLDYYMSAQQRDNIAASCSMGASASEIGRQDSNTSTSFMDGYMELVAAVQATLGESHSTATARQRALAIVTGMIGGVAVARATAKADPELSDEILAAMRSILGEIGGERR